MDRETYVIAMPCYDIERRVLLCTLEELSTELINYLPSILVDFVFGLWVEEIT
jgi:hypothetical protein